MFRVIFQNFAESRTIFLILLIVAFFSNDSTAQVPEGMNYQCALRDANGNVMVNEAVNIRFTIRQSFADNFANGPVRYQEVHNTMTNEFGLVNLEISSGTVTQFAWSNIIWGEYDYVLQVEVDAGSGYVDMGTSDFKSVPFAYLSNKAVNMNMGDLNDVETFMGVSEGDVLRFNADENYWEPQAFPSIADGVWDSDATNAWRVGGNLGLGISTPSAKLHIHGSGARFTTASYGAGLLDGLYIGQDAGTGNSLFSNNENTDIIFSTGFNERFRLGATGPIVPLDYPGHKFHLKSSFPGLGIHLTYTNTGHNDTDGVRIGLNGSSELEINQQENQNILFKRNGSTMVTVNGIGVDVNGELASDDVSTGTLNAVGANITSVDASITTTDNLYLNSAAGTGNRPLYTNASGQIYASANATKYISIPGSAFEDYWGADQTQASCFYHFSSASEGATTPVLLPDGATITSITAVMTDYSVEATLKVELIRMDLFDNTFENQLMASCSSSGSGGIQDTTDNSLSYSVIDNFNYVYWLFAKLDFDAELLVRINGIRIAYTMP